MGFITSLSKHSLSPITGKLKYFPVSLFLRNLDKKEYSVLENYILRGNNDSKVIDYLVVSKYGVFVINSKNMSGVIKNNEDGSWIQKVDGYENIIENPILETSNAVNLLKEVVSLNDSEIIPITVFNATSKLDFNLDNVINSPEIVRKIKSYGTPIINQDKRENILYSLLHANNSKPGLMICKYPVIQIINGNKNYFCPKCGSKLKISEIEKSIVCSNNKKCGLKL
ncbi:nuclease-related domain-containing protein [Methanococcus sp. CF]